MRQMVNVLWRDAATRPDMEWEDVDSSPIDDTIVQTVGFLLVEHESYVELAMSVSDTEIAGRWQIPRGCIISIRTLQ